VVVRSVEDAPHGGTDRRHEVQREHAERARHSPVAVEQPAQLAPGTGHPRPRVVLRDAHLQGDLRVREVVDDAQLERAPLVDRQRRDRVAHGRECHRVRAGAPDVGVGVAVGDLLRQGRSRQPPGSRVVADVGENLLQPRAEPPFAVRPEPAQVPERTEQRLLDRILGVLVMTQTPAGVGEEGRIVGLDDLGERVGVARAVGLDETTVCEPGLGTVSPARRQSHGPSPPRMGARCAFRSLRALPLRP
jgi:hypothetical protein